MRLVSAPSWVWALLHGTLVSVVGLVIGLESGDLTRQRVLVALGLGVVLGPLLGAAARRGTRRARAGLLADVPELAVLDETRRAEAERAARRGPVPADPAVRAGAAAVARHRWEESVTTRAVGLAFSVAIAAVQAVVAVAITPVAWLLVAVFAWLAVDAVLAPRRWSARVAALAGRSPTTARALS